MVRITILSLQRVEFKLKSGKTYSSPKYIIIFRNFKYWASMYLLYLLGLVFGIFLLLFKVPRSQAIHLFIHLGFVGIFFISSFFFVKAIDILCGFCGVFQSLATKRNCIQFGDSLAILNGLLLKHSFDERDILISLL